VTVPRAVLSAMPSPSSGTLEIGPLNLNAYGLMIAIGVIVAVRIAGRRAERTGAGTTDNLSSIALWAVPAGVVGARAYHVLTDFEKFSGPGGDFGDIVKVWQGGLGIWGGVLAGVAVGFWRAKRMNLDAWMIVSCAVPGIAVAQAIGRWGNWWNQELFGRPTDLPWALEVSDATALKAGFAEGTTFHPTFLYESIGCLLLAWALVRLERSIAPRPGMLLAWYVAGYTVIRFFIEGLRIDDAKEFAGFRLNQWVSLAAFATAVVFIIVDRRRPRAADAASTVHGHE
jgi:prolipoprotein diacylglyceryl transferase